MPLVLANNEVKVQFMLTATKGNVVLCLRSTA
jgi:hypothetical protein